MEKLGNLVGDRFTPIPRNQELRAKNQEDLNILVPRNQDKNKTEQLADYLVEKYNSPEYRNIFYRAAWHLDEATINNIVEISFMGKSSPRGYFIASVKNDKRYGKPNQYKAA